MVSTVRPQPGYAEIATLQVAASVFSGWSSPKVHAVGLLSSVSLRLVFAFRYEMTWWDGLASLVVVFLVPVFEWFVHRWVLHAAPIRVGDRVLDPGFGHRYHHRYPSSINDVVLAARETAVFQILNAVLVAVLVGLPFQVLGAPTLGPVLSGSALAIASLFYYEWVHFLFHTSYRPKSRYYKRLKRNHRYHHFRNESYWLGVTSNIGDQLMGTYPRRRSDVPISASVRSLGIEDCENS